METLEYAQEQSDIIKRFKKLTFFSYFSTFESIQRFLAILSFVFFFLVIIMTAISAYLYLDTHKRTLALVRQTNAVTSYLHQQQLLNLKTLASRIATEYSFVSYNNIDTFKSTLRPLVYPDTLQELTANIDSWGRVVIQGKLNRRLKKIDHEMVHVSEGASFNNKTTYRVTVPMEVETRKEGLSRSDVYQSDFIVIFIAGEASLNNPYGVYILEFGNANERLKKEDY